MAQSSVKIKDIFYWRRLNEDVFDLNKLISLPKTNFYSMLGKKVLGILQSNILRTTNTIVVYVQERMSCIQINSTRGCSNRSMNIYSKRS